MLKSKHDNKLDAVENRLGAVEKKVDRLEFRMEQLEYLAKNTREDLEKTKNTVDKPWDEREKVKINLTKNLLIANGGISLAVAMIVSFFTGKAITYMGKP